MLFFQSSSSLLKGRFSMFPQRMLVGMVVPWEAPLKKKKKEEEGENQFFGQICWEVLCASLRVIIILA